MIQIEPKGYGTFIKSGEYILRTATYIQWGKSFDSLGAVLMLNPGSAVLIDESQVNLLNSGEVVSGEIKLDPTMKQLATLVEELHKEKSIINGTLHIYNLYPLKNTIMDEAIKIINTGLKDKTLTLDYTISEVNKLQVHPWIIIGWGCNAKGKEIKKLKDYWFEAINKAGIKVLGKKGKTKYDYHHPHHKIPTYHKPYRDEIIKQYHLIFG